MHLSLLRKAAQRSPCQHKYSPHAIVVHNPPKRKNCTSWTRSSIAKKKTYFSKKKISETKMHNEMSERWMSEPTFKMVDVGSIGFWYTTPCRNGGSASRLSGIFQCLERNFVSRSGHQRSHSSKHSRISPTLPKFRLLWYRLVGQH